MTKKIISSIMTALCTTMLSVPSTLAHHGVNGQFDMSQSVEVTGTVTNVRFVNPHAYIYFDVPGDAGGTEAWSCELGSGSTLRRAGWSADMFQDGTQVTINGFPGRNEPYSCNVQSITFADGTQLERDDVFDDVGNIVQKERELTLADGTPNIDGNWAAPARARRGPRPGPPPGSEQTAGQRPPGPPPGQRGRPEYTLTEAGEAAVADYRGGNNPRFNCTATNIFDDWTFDQMVNRIVQTDEDIIISYGFMDIVREIHLDLKEHPAELIPSRAGHSIGRWEDGVLIVDTVGFEPGYIDAPPVDGRAVKNSDQLHTIERFSLSEDGQTLHREYQGEDPLYLVGRFQGEDSVKLIDADYEKYNCEELSDVGN